MLIIINKILIKMNKKVQNSMSYCILGLRELHHSQRKNEYPQCFHSLLWVQESLASPICCYDTHSRMTTIMVYWLWHHRDAIIIVTSLVYYYCNIDSKSISIQVPRPWLRSRSWSRIWPSLPPSSFMVWTWSASGRPCGRKSITWKMSHRNTRFKTQSFDATKCMNVHEMEPKS